MTLTEDYTFMLGDTGNVLNTDVSLPFVDITGVSGLDSAPYRETQREHEGMDGGFMDADFERGRTIILTGTVYADADDLETYLDDLKYDFAPSSSLVPFYYKPAGRAERVLFVKPLGLQYDWDTDRRTGQARIKCKMFAEDPRQYDSSLQTVVLNFAAGAVIGIGFNLGFNLDFGGTGAGASGSYVTNAGNRPTPPTFVITGPCDTPAIIDETNGHSLTFNTVLAASDTLTVNIANRTVYLNGSTNKRSTLVNPDWFYLPPGSTFIRYNALTGTGSTLSVSFRSAWR